MSDGLDVGAATDTVGGRYQLQGNAGGTIEACDPPKGLDATWEYGGAVSWIELRLAAEAPGRTRFTLAHIALPDDHWETYGPGAVGIGWDLGLHGLTAHLGAAPPLDPADAPAWLASSEGRRFMAESGERWLAADIAAGRDPELARAGADRTIAAYTGA